MKQQITKNAIQDSFLKLIQIKPFNKITVRDIVEDCGLTRNTFYYYYQDIYDIIDEIIRQGIESALDSLESDTGIDDILVLLIDSLLKNKKAVRNFARSIHLAQFYKYFDRAGDLIVDKFIAREFTDVHVSENDKRIIRDTYMYIFRGMFMRWLDSDMEYDVIPDIRRAAYLFSDAVKIAIKKAQDGENNN